MWVKERYNFATAAYKLVTSEEGSQVAIVKSIMSDYEMNWVIGVAVRIIKPDVSSLHKTHWDLPTEDLQLMYSELILLI